MPGAATAPLVLARPSKAEGVGRYDPRESMKPLHAPAPWLSLALLTAAIGCQAANAPPPQAATMPPPTAYGPPYGPAAYPAPTAWGYGAPGAPVPPPAAQPYPPSAPAAPPFPASTGAPLPPAPASPGPVPASGHPLLGPLIGSAAWQAEVRAVAKELVANLTADYQPRVATVPIVFDPNPNDVNAFASCDNSGAPFVAATEGLLDAIDAIAQTRATDELFGTQTYQTYANLVAPGIVSKGGGSALLPAGVIAPAYWVDARRINRQFFRLMQAHFWEASPAPVKAVLQMTGRGEDVLRLPMVPVSDATRRKLERMVGELGMLVGAPPTGADLRMF